MQQESGDSTNCITNTILLFGPMVFNVGYYIIFVFVTILLLAYYYLVLCSVPLLETIFCDKRITANLLLFASILCNLCTSIQDIVAHKS
jgi:hypothetical protein